MNFCIWYYCKTRIKTKPSVLPAEIFKIQSIRNKRKFDYWNSPVEFCDLKTYDGIRHTQKVLKVHWKHASVHEVCRQVVLLLFGEKAFIFYTNSYQFVQVGLEEQSEGAQCLDESESLSNSAADIILIRFPSFWSFFALQPTQWSLLSSSTEYPNRRMTCWKIDEVGRQSHQVVWLNEYNFYISC